MRVLPVSTLPSIATYDEDGARDPATVTVASVVAAVKAAAAEAAAAEAAAAAAGEKGMEVELEVEVEVEVQAETDAEATSPLFSSPAAISNPNRRCWKHARPTSSTRNLAERDGARRTLIKAKHALEREASKRALLAARSEHAESIENTDHSERDLNTGHAKSEAAAGGAIAPRLPPPLPPAPSSSPTAAMSPGEFIATEQERQPGLGRARTDRRVCKKNSQTTSNGRYATTVSSGRHSVARGAESESAGRSAVRNENRNADRSAGRSVFRGPGAGRSGHRPRLFRPVASSPERAAAMEHARATAERCVRDERKHSGGMGMLRGLRGAIGCGALGIGVGIGIGFGVGVAVCAAFMRGRRS